MALFAFGQVVATPAAIQLCEANSMHPLELVRKHVAGDWGQLSKEDVEANQNGIAFGGRIFSSYPVGDDKIWVITEADRSSTCVLLPSDY